MPEERTELSELKIYFLICLIVVLSTLIFFLPFILQTDTFLSIGFAETGMQAVYRYWDGPLYVIVSKTFYSGESLLYSAARLYPGYFAAHFPLFPFTIMMLSFIGEFEAMIVAVVIFSCLSAVIFYKTVKEFMITRSPLLLTLFFCFFPLRWFLYRNIGASEPAFVFFCLTTLYFLKKDQLNYSLISASLATLTRIFGIILLPVIVLSLLIKKQLNWKNSLKCMIIPVSLLALFLYYYRSLGDFFAYLHVNSSYVHEPFQIMTTFVSSHFGELYAILVLVYALSAIALWERGEKEMALFVFCYLPVISLVAHADASRYMIPMAPFALMAFENFFPKNKTAYIFIILLAAMFSFIYAWTMIPTNLMPKETFTAILDVIANAKK